MPKFYRTLVGLLAILTAAQGLAQTGGESGVGRLPSINSPPPMPPSQASNPNYSPTYNSTYGSTYNSTSNPVSIPVVNQTQVAGAPAVNQSASALTTTTPEPAAPEELPLYSPLRLLGFGELPAVATLDGFMGYRYQTGSLDWMPGNGNQFGMFSIDWDHYQKSGYNSGFSAGMGFHFLSGPVQTDMPPILFDFSLAYQIRRQFGPLAFDVAASVLAASDFKGNAHKGIRYPGHAVGFLTVDPKLDLVFGVDYLDRGDIKLLPVAGVIWKPLPETRFELVFPRPRAVYQLSENNRLYVSGELGGDSWAIERAETFDDDLATYRDLRVCIGLENVEKDGRKSAFEIGYLFDRHLEYNSGLGNMRLKDALILRLVTRY